MSSPWKLSVFRPPPSPTPSRWKDSYLPSQCSLPTIYFAPWGVWFATPRCDAESPFPLLAWWMGTHHSRPKWNVPFCNIECPPCRETWNEIDAANREPHDSEWTGRCHHFQQPCAIYPSRVWSRRRRLRYSDLEEDEWMRKMQIRKMITGQDDQKRCAGRTMLWSSISKWNIKSFNLRAVFLAVMRHS